MTDSVLAAIITAGVTVVGFAVTYFLTKRNVISEIEKLKSGLAIDKLADVPMELQAMLDDMLGASVTRDIATRFKSLLARVFAYGSEKAIELVAGMQELSYFSSKNDRQADQQIIAYCILLLCQIKCDISGVKINPEYWYRMRATNYVQLKNEFKSTSNAIADDLHLDDFLWIQ